MRRGAFVLLAVGWLAACGQTAYTSYDQNRSDDPPASRQVRFDLADRFYRDPPRCLTILSLDGGAPVQIRDQIERAAARHFSGKVDRVIGPDERQKLTRRLAFDLSHTGDRRRYARQTRCHHFIRPELDTLAESFALIWAGRKFGLTLHLTGVEPTDTLWRASHVAERGDGGLPFSPLSFGGAVLRAARAHGDRDQLPSMIDDVFRRMLRTLPDVRGL